MLAVCLPAGGAAAFTNVYFFGDSLSDTGNACSGLELHPGYTSGRCSNGPVWTDQLAAALGFEAVPSSQLGNNFANGGDTTEDLLSQIGVFSLFVLGAGSADPEALYVVWLGGNDVLDMPAAADAMQQAVDRIVLGIETLRELGAREFLVPNLPDVGRTFGSFAFPQGSGPAFTPAERDRVTELSLDFNARLEPALDTIPGVTIHRLDVLALLEEVFSDSAAFGLLPAAFDTTSDDTAFGVPCLADSECAADPQGPIANGFLLFDAIHPTTAMHAEIGTRATMAVPEPSAALLQVLGLCGAFALARRRRNRAPDMGPQSARRAWCPSA